MSLLTFFSSTESANRPPTPVPRVESASALTARLTTDPSEFSHILSNLAKPELTLLQLPISALPSQPPQAPAAAPPGPRDQASGAAEIEDEAEEELTTTPYLLPLQKESTTDLRSADDPNEHPAAHSASSFSEGDQSAGGTGGQLDTWGSKETLGGPETTSPDAATATTDGQGQEEEDQTGLLRPVDQPGLRRGANAEASVNLQETALGEFTEKNRVENSDSTDTVPPYDESASLDDSGTLGGRAKRRSRPQDRVQGRADANGPPPDSQPPVPREVHMQSAATSTMAGEDQAAISQGADQTAPENQGMAGTSGLPEATAANSASTITPVASPAKSAAVESSANQRNAGNVSPQTVAESSTRVNKETSAASSSASSGPRVADRVILVQRIARAFQRLGNGAGELRIRLHPQELGSVQLQMQVQGQTVNARIVAQSEMARDVLREHLPELRQRLTDGGLQVERLEVELAEFGSDKEASDWNQRHQDQLNRQAFPGQHQEGDAAMFASEERSAAPRAETQTTGDRVIAAAKHKRVDLSA